MKSRRRNSPPTLFPPRRRTRRRTRVRIRRKRRRRRGSRGHKSGKIGFSKVLFKVRVLVGEKEGEGLEKGGGGERGRGGGRGRRGV